ncbi:hypothetical protein HYU23_00725 [Candidatus Woesearchaeota archaeon]|nr:hypothetical protein [Candidatus Woesearchaeota archaeon]
MGIFTGLLSIFFGFGGENPIDLNTSKLILMTRDYVDKIKFFITNNQNKLIQTTDFKEAVDDLDKYEKNYLNLLKEDETYPNNIILFSGKEISLTLLTKFDGIYNSIWNICNNPDLYFNKAFINLPKANRKELYFLIKMLGIYSGEIDNRLKFIHFNLAKTSVERAA